jgi:iron complex outermembrane receptor protein
MKTNLFRKALFCSVALAAGMCAGAAMAQDQSTEVEELVVTAPNYVPTTNLSATKIDIPLIETPQSISVITRDQLDILNVQDLQEAVRYTSGVVAENFGDDARFDWLQIRGFQPVEFIDGLQAPVGSTTNVGLDLWGAQSVEILKGPAGVLYGATPPGGIVNLTMRRPQNEFGGEVQGQFGSYDSWQLAGDITGPIGDGRLQGRLTALWRDYGTQTELVDGRRFFIAPALKWDITPDTQLTLLGYYQNDHIDGNSSGFLPAQGTLLPNPNGQIPVERNVGEPDYNLFTREQYGIGYEFSHRFNEHVSIKQNLKYSQQDENFVSIYGVGFVDDNFDGTPDDYRTINRNNFVFPEFIRSFSVDTRAEFHGETGEIRHTALVGVDYRRLKNDTDFGFGFGPALRLDIYDPVYGKPIPPLDFALGPNIRRQDTQVGIYAQDQMAYGGWRLTLTGRHDWLDTDSFGADFSDDTAFTGRVGLNYIFDNGLAPYAAYATSFLPVPGAHFDGTPFDPTTGRQFEVGVKWEPKLGRDVKIFASAAAYTLTQENVLTNDPAHLFFSVQTGEVKVQGLELEAVARIHERITLNASYTYTDSEVTKSNGPDLHKELPIVAKNKASVFGDYTFQDGPLAGFGAGVGLRYLGPSFGDAANTPILKGEAATVVDLTVHYDWKQWKIAFNASNLFDNIYVQRCSDFNTCFYGIRRNMTLTLGRKF